MLITYKPAAREHEPTRPRKLNEAVVAYWEEPREWHGVKLKRLMNPEAEALEDVTDWSLDEIQMRLTRGSVKAIRALLWVLLKRTYQPLKYRDVEIMAEEVALDYEPDEVEDILDAMRKDPDFSEEDIAQARAVLLPDGEAPKDEAETVDA